MAVQTTGVLIFIVIWNAKNNNNMRQIVYTIKQQQIEFEHVSRTCDNKRTNPIINANNRELDAKISTNSQHLNLHIIDLFVNFIGPFFAVVKRY